MRYILKMPFQKSVKLIGKAREENRKDRLFSLYSNLYPNFSKDNFMSFEDFVEKSMPEKINYDGRSTAEIMAEISEVEKKFNN